ncbi:MAG: MATE family efflux transporter [Clostridia bacterium]|nr:MATE family efflux transporter [Clostridia bacterium]
MKRSATHDMTTGNAFPLLIGFAIPHFMGLLLQQLYGIMDSVVVGRMLGADALAAVGTSTFIYNMLVMGAGSAMNGFSTIIARRVGAKDQEGIRQTFYVALIMMFCITAALYIIAFSAYRPLLNIMNTPEELMADAAGYISVFLSGIVFLMLYNLLAGAIRAMGNSKIPFYILIATSFCNVILNFVLIYFMRTVAAAAWATVICQAISCVLGIIVIWKKFPELHIKKENRKFSSAIAKACLKIGLPMFMQGALITGGGMIGQSARNLFGTAVIASFSAVSRCNSIMFGAFASVGAAMLTYCNQNIGAGKPERIHSGIKKALAMNIVSAAVYSLLMFFFVKWFILLFVGGDSAHAEEMVAFAEYYRYFLIPGFMVVCLIEPYRNTLNSIGLSIVPVLACGQELITRSLFAYLAGKYQSINMICVAESATWILATIPLIVAYVWWYHKKLKPKMAEKTA